MLFSPIDLETLPKFNYNIADKRNERRSANP